MNEIRLFNEGFSKSWLCHLWIFWLKLVGVIKGLTKNFEIFMRNKLENKGTKKKALKKRLERQKEHCRCAQKLKSKKREENGWLFCFMVYQPFSGHLIPNWILNNSVKYSFCSQTVECQKSSI